MFKWVNGRKVDNKKEENSTSSELLQVSSFLVVSVVFMVGLSCFFKFLDFLWCEFSIIMREDVMRAGN